MKRFLINSDDISDRHVRLTGQEAHHARYVLRLPVEAEVILMDGQGSEYPARIAGFDRSTVDLEIVEKRPAVGESPLDLTLAVGILKPEPMDAILRQGTELGLTTLVPLITENTDVRLNPGQMEKRMVRWQRVARQSIKQCRRGRALTVTPITRWDEFLQRLPDVDLSIMLDPYGGAGNRIRFRDLDHSGCPITRVVAVVGPEGGFTPAEREQAREAGFRIVSAGPRILKGETAALAVCAILGSIYGDIG